ncbi:MAG: hypothetical protein ACLGG0_09030 [Bacteriovoracia bacterium]
MDKSVKNVLLSFNYNSYFENLYGVLKLLNTAAGYKSVVIFPLSYNGVESHVRLVQSLGVKVLDPLGEPWVSGVHKMTSKELSKNKYTPQKTGSLRHNLKTIYLFFTCFRKTKKELKKFKKVIKTNKIELVITGGEIVGTDTSLLIKAAKSLKVPSVLFVNWLGEHEGATMYLANPDHQIRGMLARFVKIWLSKWTYAKEGQTVIRLPAYQVLALELLGLSSKNPWVLHQGRADKIAVEGSNMLDRAKRMGLPSQALVATGAPFHDDIFETLRNKRQNKDKLFEKYSFKVDQPILLVAIPPDFLYPISGVPQCPQCDFQDYVTMVRYWMQVVSKDSKFNVIVSVHPSTDRTTLDFVSEYGASIADEKITELIPLADAYVACVSATIGIAISCGVPVINYDVYRFHYSDYKSFPGVYLVHEMIEFENAIHNLSMQDGFYKELKENQLKDMSKYALIDGKTNERILKLLSELA